MASNHASKEATDKPNRFESRREAELAAGRRRVEDRSAALIKAGRADGKQIERSFKDAQRGLDEDLKKREELLDTAKSFTQREADRAGAEVIDQAQTELEAVGHLANNDEPILDYRRQANVERLKDGADPQAATEITTDVVTAQAVNQPTVLANDAGKETEGRPLNVTDQPDSALALNIQQTPEDKHVPKTQAKARKTAKAKVPPAEKVVKEQAVVTQDKPEKNEAVEIVRKAPDDALGE